MKKLIAFLFALLPLISPAQTLTGDARISLITCSSGNELYSLFGHSALRVQDKTNGMDLVFNYGTFDFNTKNFYLKYAQGLLPFQLSVTQFPYFINAYIHENRSVFSQELLLDSINKQQLFNALKENFKPANRTYLYNFLYDNCSTRIRDIIQSSASDTINWNIHNDEKTFWNLLDEYLVLSPWVKWGIHTILGQSGNKQATTYEYMFLPDYLMQGFGKAELNGKPLAGKVQTLYLAPKSTLQNHWYTSPLFVFSIIVALIIFLIIHYKSRKLEIGISFVMFLASGLLGCLLIFLGYFTEHPMTSPNFNLLWANPLNLAVLPSLFRKHLHRYISFYLIVYALLLLICVSQLLISLPAMPLASIPIICLMFFLSYVIKNNAQ